MARTSPATLEEIIDDLDPTGTIRVKGAAKAVAPVSSPVADPTDLPPLAKRIARAVKYLTRLPASVQGANGSAPAFAAARALIHGFCLDHHSALSLLLAEYNPRCEPPWSERELAHKLADAEAKPFNKPRGWLLAPKARPTVLTTATLPAPPADAVKAESATPPVEANTRASVVQIDPYLGLNESDDDPHRLARGVLSGYQSRNRRTLVFWQGEFHSWDGVSYRTCEEGEFRALANRAVRRDLERVHRARLKEYVPNEGEKMPAMTKVTESLVSNVLGSLRGICLLSGVDLAPTWINAATGPAPRELVAAKNGVIHLPKYAEKSTHAVTKNTPDYFNFNAVGFDATHAAPRPESWHEFLSQLWPDDADSIALLQEWMGYLLTPDNRMQKMLLLVGPKRSGKGTIARVLQELVGVANCANPTLGSMGGDFGLETLIGKSVAVIEDARLSHKSDISVITERFLTVSGGGRLDVNRKQIKHYTTMLNTRFVVCTNEIPNLTDASGALPSRWSVLQMTRSFFGKEDRELADRLLAELPGIFNWAVEGWARLQARGKFTTPASSQDSIDDLTNTSSPIGEFVTEKCVLGGQYSVSVDDLFSMWKGWCDSNGVKEPGTKNFFARRLKAYAHTITNAKSGGRNNRTNVYIGIGERSSVYLDDVCHSDEHSRCPDDLPRVQMICPVSGWCPDDLLASNPNKDKELQNGVQMCPDDSDLNSLRDGNQNTFEIGAGSNHLIHPDTGQSSGHRTSYGEEEL